MGTIRYWDSRSFECVAIGRGHVSSIHVIESVDDRKLFTSGSADGTLKVWNLDNCVKSVVCHRNEVNDVAIAPNKQLLVCCGADGKINLFALRIADGCDDGTDIDLDLIKTAKPGRHRNLKRGKGAGVWAVVFSANDRLIASSHDDGQIMLWTVDTLQCAKVLQSKSANNPLLHLLFVNHSTQILATSSDGMISVWSLRQNECIREYRKHADKIWKMIAFGKDFYISIGCDSIINVYRDETVQNERLRIDKLHKMQQNKTKIDNAIRHKRYGIAIKLCLQLDEPQKLFSFLLREWAQIKSIKQIMLSLDYKELSLLITYCIDFNT